MEAETGEIPHLWFPSWNVNEISCQRCSGLALKDSDVCKEILGAPVWREGAVLDLKLVWDSLSGILTNLQLRMILTIVQSLSHVLL